MANRRITDLTTVTYISSSLYIPVYDPDANLDIDADGYLDNDKKIRLNDFMSVPSQSAMTWFGTGVDGDLYTTSSLTFTTTLNQNVLIKNYKSLVINAGHTLTVSNSCKGLLIYVGGDCIINGTLTMNQKGANPASVSGVEAHYVYQNRDYLGDFFPIWYFNTNNDIGYIRIPAAGATAGSSGINGQTGGAYPGGTAGTSWSGGSYSGNLGGGLLILVVKGNLTIGSTGIISSNGSSISGGGRVVVLYNRNYTNNGSITVTGYAAGSTTVKSIEVWQ